MTSIRPLLLVPLAGLLLVALPAGAEGTGPVSPLQLESDSPALGPDGQLAEHVGFEVGEGRLAPVLRAGSPCPCERTVSYSTALDDQTEIPVRVLRGASGKIGEGTLIGALEIRGIEPRPAGRALVRVTLRAENGRIEIQAVDGRTGEPLPLARTDAPVPAAAP